MRETDNGETERPGNPVQRHYPQTATNSRTLLYEMYLCCVRELPKYTKEIAFDLLAFRFRMYAEVLKTGDTMTEPVKTQFSAGDAGSSLVP
jgi:hypothetical protein